LSFPTSTAYVAPVPVKRCDAAAFVKDVTIPDGSPSQPRENVFKNMALQNVGSCSWNSSYALIFISGDGMSAPSVVRFIRQRKPGETVDVTVNLVSPSKKGHYRNYWKLRNASGVLFGIGSRPIPLSGST
jgi:next to BRCA1 gene 1 protein